MALRAAAGAGAVDRGGGGGAYLYLYLRGRRGRPAPPGRRGLRGRRGPGRPTPSGRERRGDPPRHRPGGRPGRGHAAGGPAAPGGQRVRGAAPGAGWSGRPGCCWPWPWAPPGRAGAERSAPPGSATFDVPPLRLVPPWASTASPSSSAPVRRGPCSACPPSSWPWLRLRRSIPGVRRWSRHRPGGGCAALVAIAGASDRRRRRPGDAVPGGDPLPAGDGRGLVVCGRDGPAGGRLILAGGAGMALLFCVLTLGVNGLFALSQLSTAGFTDGAFRGPGPGRRHRRGRPLPRLAPAPGPPSPTARPWPRPGGAALALLLGAFRPRRGPSLPAGPRGWWSTAGWRPSPPSSSPSAGGRPPCAWGPSSPGRPAVSSRHRHRHPGLDGAAVLYATVTLPSLGLLWWLAARPPGRGPRAPPQAVGPRPRHSAPLWRHPGFWLLDPDPGQRRPCPGRPGGPRGASCGPSPPGPRAT